MLNRNQRTAVATASPDSDIDQMRILATRRSPIETVDLSRQILSQDLFLQRLCLERKRAERSHKNFALLLFHLDDFPAMGNPRNILNSLDLIVNVGRRKTDLAGWYEQNSIVGIIFNDLGADEDAATIYNRLRDRFREAVSAKWGEDSLRHINSSLHVLGGRSADQGSDDLPDPVFYPDLFRLERTKKSSLLLLKRGMDIVGSAGALILLAPVLVVLSATIKLTSKGPVFFKQERLGLFGKKFTCLKLRSMYADNDSKIHQEFMKRLISGAHDGKSTISDRPTYKMTNDPRVTPIGRILRRYSLDELLQFINVLRGDMSLVGPRPPLAYEFKEYNMWHRRRVLEAKPGLTGLWQVKGRSRVNFDDMVRLDLQYVLHWSLWLDIQILIQTPRAVLSGDGAY
jgi:lipopolysaccharide/colanic/teichoic acid biosynthesis glycosyltransferase